MKHLEEITDKCEVKYVFTGMFRGTYKDSGFIPSVDIKVLNEKNISTLNTDGIDDTSCLITSTHELEKLAQDSIEFIPAAIHELSSGKKFECYDTKKDEFTLLDNVDTYDILLNAMKNNYKEKVDLSKDSLTQYSKAIASIIKNAKNDISGSNDEDLNKKLRLVQLKGIYLFSTFTEYYMKSYKTKTEIEFVDVQKQDDPNIININYDEITNRNGFITKDRKKLKSIEDLDRLLNESDPDNNIAKYLLINHVAMNQSLGYRDDKKTSIILNNYQLLRYLENRITRKK